MPRAAQRASVLDALIELLSSMRFAISLLTILAIASVIGTVVQQNEAANAYLNQFGQFWEPIFARLGLYTLYNTGWFVAILAFLVLSTTLCIIRQFTPMLREIRSFREHAREASLRLFAHHASLSPCLPPEARREAASAYLTRAGFRFRVDEREGDTLIAAKQGSAGRIGYFLAHGAIVLICAGGLLDGNLPLALQMRLDGKSPSSGSQTIGEVPSSARLDRNNWSYRGNLYIPEGSTSSFAVLNVDDGILLQPLPFKVTLKRFHIEHYENGMPKRYTSDIVITEEDTGKSFDYALEVNKPLEHRGVTLFQSGYDDGGSRLNLTLRGLGTATHPPFPLEAEVGAHIPLGSHTLEITGFRPINVENFAAPDNENRLADFFGGGLRAQQANKKFRNLGPVFNFKLRDKAGQAREFSNYMQPLEINGHWYLYSGVRTTQAEPFAYLRIPLDNDGKVDTWFAIRQSFLDPEQHPALAERFARHDTDSKGKVDKALYDRLKATAEHTLALFARGGLEAIDTFIKTAIPEQERENAGAAFIQVLQGLVWDAWMSAREAAGQSVLQPDDIHAPYIRDTLAAIIDSQHYGAPFHVQLTGFEQRQATILQATRSPGKPLVYAGSLLLVLGIFAMLYIRERRLFVLLKHDEALIALSSNRKTIDLDESFARHLDGLANVLQAKLPVAAPQN